MLNSKKQTPYPYNDKVIMETVENDVHFRVISNERGVFVDIRKYFNMKPTQKGVRMPVDSFDNIYKAYMNSEHDEMRLDEEDENEDLKLKQNKQNKSKLKK